MNTTVIFAPLIPWPVIVGLAVFAGLVLIFAALCRMPGLLLRTCGVVVLLGALAGPVYQQEERRALDDVVLLVRDESASQRLKDRAELTQSAADSLTDIIAARPNTELREITVGDGDDNSGTLLAAALKEALADVPRNRVAATILLSDGLAHDAESFPDMPSPVHLLHTGHPEDWDRLLRVKTAPAFGILDEEIEIVLHLSDEGNAPDTTRVPLQIALNGSAPITVQVPRGRDISLPLTLERAGRNVVEISTPKAEGELTDQNNAALIQINGVRDRLRVLLVSGEPYQGERTWRNLLKSDSSVDLVHFTILRPPEKQDGVPVYELSLIAFPTYELFMEKVDDFDLIIFDRYKRRGILPTPYLENIQRYLVDGGALLIAAGPDFAGVDSLYRTPLRASMPGAPTARILDQPFLPRVNELGQRHPVTAGLQSGPDPDWGRWLRQIEMEPAGGDVVMTGAQDAPLLMLDRVGEGRIALLASDQAWLWHRGYEGGGPQLELLRRLAHWLMKEPELEEEALWAETHDNDMRIIRRSLDETVSDVEITTPGGDVVTLPMQPNGPGEFIANYQGGVAGLYRLANDALSAVVGLGPASPIEFSETIATPERLAPVLETTGGGVLALTDGLPTLRQVREGARAHGRGWIGIWSREAYETRSIRQMPMLPQWLLLCLLLSLLIIGWLREGRARI